MPDWLTDAQLFDTADRLGKKIVEMYTHAGLFIDRIPLLEPLPLDTDVNGADFSYGKFFHEDRSRDTFSPRVEDQRKKNQDQPVGLIGRRLAGDR